VEKSAFCSIPTTLYTGTVTYCTVIT